MAAACRRCCAARLWPVPLANKTDAFLGRSVLVTATTAANALVARSSSALSSTRVAYPELKAEYPPGSWGDISPRVAWKWYEKGQAVTGVRSVQERLIQLETAAPKNRFKVYALSCQPRLLAYRQYITKTHVIHGLPDMYKSLPAKVNLDALQSAVEDVVVDERVKLKRFPPAQQVRPAPQPFVPVDKIVSTLLTHLSLVSPQLCSDQVDRNVISRACWYRKAPRGMFCRGQSHDIDDTCVRYMYTGDVSLQIRSEKPLADVVPLTDSLCRGSYPVFNYSPSCVGQFTELCSPRQLPGFLYGDPCQYSATAVLDCSALEPMRANTSADIYHEALIGAGVVLPFGLLAGEAYYDGFTQYDDVMHPMTMQAIITDGREFMFSVYQLNTLRLFVDDVANPLRNLCWVSGTSPMKLYDDVSPDGKVLGFNKDVLLHLVAFLLRERKHSHVCQQPLPTGELFPYRPQYERLTNLPVLLEGSVNIPTAVKYTKGRRSDGRPHGSKKTLLDTVTGKRVVVSTAN